MILGFISAIFALIGIVGFYINNYTLLIIGGVVSIIEILRGLFTGQLKSITTTIIAAFIGYIIIKDFWYGILLGICFENIIMFSFGSIALIISALYYNKNEPANNNDISWNEYLEKNFPSRGTTTKLSDIKIDTKTKK